MMSAFTLQFFMTYLLVPLIALVMGIVLFFIAKKNNLLSNKKLIFYLLATGVILGLPGLLGFLGYVFMPYTYIVLQIVYLLLGVFNTQIMHKHLSEIEKKPYILEVVIIFVTMVIGVAIFSILFNILNEMQYGLLASSCMIPFIIPSLFKKTYQELIGIPVDIFRVWKYDPSTNMSRFDLIDYSNLMVLELELFKQPSDKIPLQVKVKAPGDIPFGNWFHKFIDDYNLKFPGSPIIYVDNHNDYYGWIFYVKPSFLQMRKYIDFDKNVSENKIKESYTIIAKRVIESQSSSEE